MSRPGYVFDLTSDRVTKNLSYRCRICGWSEQTPPASKGTLYGRMTEHVREKHGLESAAAWKITEQERNESESVVCFWPPEAL